MDSALRVVDHLHNTLKSAAQYFSEQESVSSEDVFIRSGVTQDVAATLADATADAAMLQQSQIDAHDFNVEDFRSKHDAKVQAILKDLLAVQTRGKEDDSSEKPELVSTTAQFALDLVESTSRIIDHNAARIKEQVSSSPFGGLHMANPGFPQKLITHVRQTLQAYVARDELYQEASANVKQLTAQITKLRDASSTEVAALQDNLAILQDENVKLQDERDQLRHKSDLLRIESELLRAEQEQLRRDAGVFATEKTSMEAKHATDLAAAQSIIEQLTANVNRQQAAHIALTSELEEMKTTVSLKADWSRMKADSEAKERTRLTSLNQTLEQQIEELKRTIQEQSVKISRKHQDAEVQTPLVIRVPGPAARGSMEESAALSTKRSFSRMEGEGGPPTAIHRNTRESRSSSDTPPEHLAAQLAVLPTVTVDLPSNASEVQDFKFTRGILKCILGGNPAQLVARVGKKSTPLASQYNIQSYLCAPRSRFAWLPSAPGQHGFLPFDLDGLASSGGGSATPEGAGPTWHLFIGNGDEPETIEFEYCGLYLLTNMGLLTKEDWALLPEYAQTHCIDKKIRQLKASNVALGREVIRPMYRSGEYRVPCARLKCIAFDVAFYKRLVEASAGYREPQRPNGSNADQQLSDRSPASKKRRMAGAAGAAVTSPQDPEHNIDDMYASPSPPPPYQR